jgi:hypothetical protein
VLLCKLADCSAPYIVTGSAGQIVAVAIPTALSRLVFLTANPNIFLTIDGLSLTVCKYHIFNF